MGVMNRCLIFANKANAGCRECLPQMGDPSRWLATGACGLRPRSR